MLLLIAHDRTLGALSLVSVRENASSSADAELLGQGACQIAIAVENALNFERAQVAEQQAKHQSERLQLLLQVNAARTLMSSATPLTGETGTH